MADLDDVLDDPRFKYRDILNQFRTLGYVAELATCMDHIKNERNKKRQSLHCKAGEEGLRGRAHCVIALFIYAWTIQMYPVSLSLSLSLSRFPSLHAMPVFPFPDQFKTNRCKLGKYNEKVGKFLNEIVSNCVTGYF